MNNPTTQRTAQPGCCAELKCESGLRNNYYEGKRLTADSFRVEQKYLLERRRLLNRAIHGWGVVYGYEVTATPPCKGTGPGRLEIGAGLALDKCGRELLQTETPIEINDLIILDENGAPIDPESVFSAVEAFNRQGVDDPERKRWLLSVHYAEQYAGRVTVEDQCRCARDEWDHTCETVRYSLRPSADAERRKDLDCELQCDCGTGTCCDEPIETDNETPHTEADMPRKRGGCHCLCEHLTKLQSPDCCCLREIEGSCGRVWVDLKNGVPLARVDLALDDCNRWTFGRVEACGPRQLVKRNDLLFDLIRGCDLTRISDISWKEWHRKEIEFKDFSDAFGPEGYHQEKYVTNFSVKFSRPVRENTLQADCIAMTVMCNEREGNWWQTFRVPIVDLKCSPREPKDPEHHVREAKVVVAGDWVEDGLRGRGSVFNDYETRIEIEVRGDFIVDCNGQTVDANAVGLSPAPTGNGTPGGAFLSTFLVAPRKPPTRTDFYDRGESLKGVSS